MTDLTGRKFGRWTVTRFDKRIKDGSRFRYFWHCKCTCGQERDVRIDALFGGESTSCGCFTREQVSKSTSKGMTTHGGSRKGEYRIWAAIKGRCGNPKNPAFMYYGGRGITVCQRWKKSFQAFFEDMGPRPSVDHSIERVNNAEGYSKNNCVWANRFRQMNNTRKNRYLEFNRYRMTMAQWSRFSGIDYQNLVNRINKLGWSIEDALTIPVTKRSL